MVSQSLIDLLCGPLRKKTANPWSRLQKQLDNHAKQHRSRGQVWDLCAYVSCTHFLFLDKIHITKLITLKWTTQGHLLYSQCYTTSTSSSSKMFHHPQNRTLIPLAGTPVLPPKALSNHWSDFCFYRFSFSGPLK